MTMNPTPLPRRRAPKQKRVRLYTRLTKPLREHLHAYSKTKGRSERAVIEEAIARYLANPAKDPSTSGPIDRLAQAIDDDRRVRERQHRDLELLSETLGQFLRVWMSVHAPTIAPTIKEPAALAAGEELYLGFAATVAEMFRRGHRFVHDLPGFGGGRPKRDGKQ